MAKTIAELNPPLNPILVTNIQDARNAVDFLLQHKRLGFDTETSVTDTLWTRKVRTIQLGQKDKQFIFDLKYFANGDIENQGFKITPKWFTELKKVLTPLLCSYDYVKCGFNLQFDFEVMLWCLGMRTFGFFGCDLMEKLLLAGKVNFKQRGIFGAKPLILKYTNYNIDKELQTSFDLYTDLTQDQMNYGGADCRFPIAVANAQLKLLEAEGMLVAADIENKAIPWFGETFINGFYADTNCWLDLVNKCKAKHKQNVEELDKYFIPVVGEPVKPEYDLVFLENQWRSAPYKTQEEKAIRAAYRKEFNTAKSEVKEYEANIKSYEGKAAINYDSPIQLLAALKKMGFKRLTDTNDRTLEKTPGDVIKAIQSYRTTSKLLKSYGEAFIEKSVNSLTGRIHSKLDQMGAETGRTASNNPNLQNIPTWTESNPNTFNWRSAFKAQSEENCLVVADYDGCELRIMAELSNEPVWIKAFNEGKDVHSLSAEMILGDMWKAGAEENCLYYKTGQKCKCPKHKEMRDWIKAVNFGIAYGMAAGKLSDSIKQPREYCQELLGLWNRTLSFCSKMLNESGMTAKMLGWSVTLAGRRRYYPKPDWEKCKEYAMEEAQETGKPVTQEKIRKIYGGIFAKIEREGKNSPIQGSNADIAKRAMQYLFDSELESLGAKPVMFVHDEFVYECPKNVADKVKTIVEECMMRAGKDFVKKIQMPASAKISEVWEK